MIFYEKISFWDCLSAFFLHLGYTGTGCAGGTADPANTTREATEAPVKDQEKEPQNSQDKQDDVFPWWGYAVIILGGITAGIGIALILIKRKKKS